MLTKIRDDTKFPAFFCIFLIIAFYTLKDDDDDMLLSNLEAEFDQFTSIWECDALNDVVMTQIMQVRLSQGGCAHIVLVPTAVVVPFFARP